MSCSHDINLHKHTMEKLKVKGLPSGMCICKCKKCKEEIEYIRIDNSEWIEN